MHSDVVSVPQFSATHLRIGHLQNCRAVKPLLCRHTYKARNQLVLQIESRNSLDNKSFIFLISKYLVSTPSLNPTITIHIFEVVFLIAPVYLKKEEEETFQLGGLLLCTGSLFWNHSVAEEYNRTTDERSLDSTAINSNARSEVHYVLF